MSKANLVKTIYLYVFSGVGLSLFIIGVFMAIQYLVNTTQFEKYPLNTWEETQCEYPPYLSVAKPMPVEETTDATPSAEEVKKQEERCTTNQESMRNRKRVDDLTRALTFLVIGPLVFFPHWRMTKKLS